MLKYSQRFRIYDTTTTSDVWMKRVFVWEILGSMGVQTVACIGERLGGAEMFWAHFGIALGGAEDWELKLARR